MNLFGFSFASFPFHFLPTSPLPFASLPINFPAVAQFFSLVNFPTPLPFHSFPCPPPYPTPFLSFPLFTPYPTSFLSLFSSTSTPLPFSPFSCPPPYPTPFFFLPLSNPYATPCLSLPLATPTPLTFSTFPCPPPYPSPFLSLPLSTSLPLSLFFSSLVPLPTPFPFLSFPCPPPYPSPFPSLSLSTSLPHSLSSLSFSFSSFSTSLPPGWALQILNDQRIIFSSKFLIPGYFGVGKFGKYLFRWLDLSTEDFGGYAKQSEDSW